MIKTKTLTVIFFVIFLLGSSSVDARPVPDPANHRIIRGEIREVFPQQQKIRIYTDQGLEILTLAKDAQIYRGEQQVQLESARPITDEDFQEAVLLLDPSRRVLWMTVHYQLYELQVEGEAVVVRVDIFGNIKH